MSGKCTDAVPLKDGMAGNRQTRETSNKNEPIDVVVGVFNFQRSESLAFKPLSRWRRGRNPTSLIDELCQSVQHRWWQKALPLSYMCKFGMINR